MKPNRRILAAAAASMFFATAAMAADDDNPAGFYVGAGAGRFSLNVRSLEDAGAAARTIVNSHDNSWKIFAGYRFSRFFGAEAAYIDLGRPSDTFSGTGSNGNYRLAVSGFAPSLIGRLPVGPVELFAKAGEYYYNVDTRVRINPSSPEITSRHSRDDFIWGGGVSVAVAQRVELRVEYDKLEIQNAPDSDAFWLAAAWRF